MAASLQLQRGTLLPGRPSSTATVHFSQRISRYFVPEGCPARSDVDNVLTESVPHETTFADGLLDAFVIGSRLHPPVQRRRGPLGRVPCFKDPTRKGDSSCGWFML